MICTAGSFFLFGCSDDGTRLLPPPGYITMEFQDGVYPDQYYTGTRDAVLKAGAAFAEENYGQVSLDTIGTVDLTGELIERRVILRFDLSLITSCADVKESILSIRVEPGAGSSVTLGVYRATVPALLPASWPEGTGQSFDGVTWLTADGTVFWNEPGGDYLPTLLAAATVTDDTIATFILPDDAVYHWIKFPEDNHGVIIKSQDTSAEGYRLVHFRESGTAEMRPYLSVKYRDG